MNTFTVVLIAYLLSVVLSYLAIKKDYKNQGLVFDSLLLVFILIPIFNVGACLAATGCVIGHALRTKQ